MRHGLGGKGPVLVVLAGLCGVGCSGQLPALRPPEIDPVATAEAALALYDENQDGSLKSAELKKAVALEFSLDRIDDNNDKAVTAKELADMMQTHWLDAGAGVIRVKVYVTMNRRPLPGATITFEPEPYLADALHPATGVTDGNGFAAMTVAPEHQLHENARGVAPGFYRVSISLEEDGQERIPAKYNAQTTLGVEVAARASYMPGHIELALRK